MNAARELEVLEAGVRSSLQDGGRPGQRRLGVGAAGPADRASAHQANRLVGNPDQATLVEVTLGGLEVRAGAALTLAVTGAPCPVTLDAVPVRTAVVAVRPGQRLRLGEPPRGLRSYVAVAGGVVASGRFQPVLGSLSWDSLGGLGPAPLVAGDVLAVGAAPDPVVPPDVVPWVSDPALAVEIVTGPHADWFVADPPFGGGDLPWVVGATDRVATRLEGAVVARRRPGELATTGLVRGAIQVAGGGQPLVMGADHPTTGGYPVVAVATGQGADRVSQARPGDRLRLVRRPG